MRTLLSRHSIVLTATAYFRIVEEDCERLDFFVHATRAPSRSAEIDPARDRGEDIRWTLALDPADRTNIGSLEFPGKLIEHLAPIDSWGARGSRSLGGAPPAGRRRRLSDQRDQPRFLFFKPSQFDFFCADLFVEINHERAGLLLHLTKGRTDGSRASTTLTWHLDQSPCVKCTINQARRNHGLPGRRLSIHFE